MIFPHLTELVVEGTLGAVLADEAALDEDGAGRGGGAHPRPRPTVVRQQANLAVRSGVVLLDKWIDR